MGEKGGWEKDGRSRRYLECISQLFDVELAIDRPVEASVGDNAAHPGPQVLHVDVAAGDDASVVDVDAKGGKEIKRRLQVWKLVVDGVDGVRITLSEEGELGAKYTWMIH